MNVDYVRVCVWWWWWWTHTHSHPSHLHPLVCFSIMSPDNADHQYAERTEVHPKQSESTGVPTRTLKDIKLASITLDSTRD